MKTRIQVIRLVEFASRGETVFIAAVLEGRPMAGMILEVPQSEAAPLRIPVERMVPTRNEKIVCLAFKHNKAEELNAWQRLNLGGLTLVLAEASPPPRCHAVRQRVSLP